MASSNDRYRLQNRRFSRQPKKKRHKPCDICGGIGMHLPSCRKYKEEK